MQGGAPPGQLRTFLGMTSDSMTVSALLKVLLQGQWGQLVQHPILEPLPLAGALAHTGRQSALNLGEIQLLSGSQPFYSH